MQIWQELPLLLIGALFALLVVVLPWTVLYLTGIIPLALVTAAITVAPVWGITCTLFGRSVLGYKIYWWEWGIAFHYYYLRICLLAIIPALLIGIISVTVPWGAIANSVGVMAGLTVQVFVVLTVTMMTFYALPLMTLFDLSIGYAWMYSFALFVHWPMVAVGLMALTYLLSLSTPLLPPLTWLLLPVILIPFVVNATLMLAKRKLASESGQPNGSEYLNRIDEKRS